MEFISDSFSLLSFKTHDILAKASVLTTIILRTDFENISQRKMKQILQEFFFYDFFREV